MKILTYSLLTALLLSCSKEDLTQTAFYLKSDDLIDGTQTNSTFNGVSCGGANTQPQFNWKGIAPGGTKSFALTLINKDNNDFIHWIVYNLPQSFKSLPQALPLDLPALNGLNSFGNSYYSGPCSVSSNLETFDFNIWAIRLVNLAEDTSINFESASSIYLGIKRHSLGTSLLRVSTDQ